LISEDTENGINHYSQTLYQLSYARSRHSHKHSHNTNTSTQQNTNTKQNNTHIQTTHITHHPQEYHTQHHTHTMHSTYITSILHHTVLRSVVIQQQTLLQHNKRTHYVRRDRPFFCSLCLLFRRRGTFRYEHKHTQMVFA
jgi:hypothetical protein